MEESVITRFIFADGAEKDVDIITDFRMQFSQNLQKGKSELVIFLVDIGLKYVKEEKYNCKSFSFF